MSEPNPYRSAIEVLQRGHDVQMESLADEILQSGEDLAEGGFLYQEFLESQGAKLHFYGLIVSQLEQSAEQLDESRRVAKARAEFVNDPSPRINDPSTGGRRRKSRSKKLQQTSAESQADES